MKVKINKSSGIAYIPDDLRDVGFVGEVIVISNSGVAVMLNPVSSPEELRQAMKNIISDIEAQLKRGVTVAG